MCFTEETEQLLCLAVVRKEAKLFPQQAVEADRFVRCLGSLIFLDISLIDGGDVAIRPLTPRKIPGTHFC
jgi:hypothetical protein